MSRNIKSESNLSDNEKNAMYLIKYKDYKLVIREVAILAISIDEASRLFRKYEGPKAEIIGIQKLTESEYQEMRL